MNNGLYINPSQFLFSFTLYIKETWGETKIIKEKGGKTDENTWRNDKQWLMSLYAQGLFALEPSSGYLNKC